MSILGQTYRQRHLFWRDDGSIDETMGIMHGAFRLSPLDSRSLGITRSYANLFRIACDADYQWFALADQDDVWAPDKLERGIRALEGLTVPTLYCARQTLVDSNLHPLGSSAPFRPPIGFPAALTQNVAAGCTIILNRAGADLLRATLSDQPYHDWWCYLIVAAAGGQIVTDDAEVIRYRQHASNVIGAPTTYWRRGVAAIRRGPLSFMAILRRHVEYLQVHVDLLTPKAQCELTTIAEALQRGPRSRWQALRMQGFRRQTVPEDLLFRLWFLLG